MRISNAKITPFLVPELGSSGNGRPHSNWFLGIELLWGWIQEIQSSADSPPHELLHAESGAHAGGLELPSVRATGQNVGVHPPGWVPPAELDHVVSTEHQRAALPRMSYGQAL